MWSALRRWFGHPQGDGCAVDDGATAHAAQGATREHLKTAARRALVVVLPVPAALLLAIWPFGTWALAVSDALNPG